MRKLAKKTKVKVHERLVRYYVGRIKDLEEQIDQYKKDMEKNTGVKYGGRDGSDSTKGS